MNNPMHTYNSNTEKLLNKSYNNHPHPHQRTHKDLKKQN